MSSDETHNHRFASGDLTLAAHLVVPDRPGPKRYPCVVICHGFPAASTGSKGAGRNYVQLADRIAREMGWVVMAVSLRGIGNSEGDFSLAGWLQDLQAAVTHAAELEGVTGVWLAGFGTGGALAICAGAEIPEVRGVAAMAPPADFADWASRPESLLEHARARNAIRSDDFPEDLDAWAAELSSVSAVSTAEALAPRPMLVVHGKEDDAVLEFDARAIADAHGTADLRLIEGAGHALRYDPRAVAMLLGWLGRQRS